MPYRTSARVIAVVNTDEGSCTASQSRTLREGTGLSTSDNTFVSSTITGRVWADAAQLHVAGTRVPRRQKAPHTAESIRRDCAGEGVLPSLRPSGSHAPPLPWSVRGWLPVGAVSS